VREAVVLGVDDSKWGQRVVAVIEANLGPRSIQPSVPELTSFLRERVGRYKVPKEFHFWEELPRTPTGKPRRAEVRVRLQRSADRS
jgi:acyl-CoA synthetase (AMP-forming)/AMP-acid ligase II